MELEEIISKEAEEMAIALRKEHQDDSVGAENTKEILNEGRKYVLKVEAFWEKVSHYNYSCKNVGGLCYEKYGSLIIF